MMTNEEGEDRILRLIGLEIHACNPSSWEQGLRQEDHEFQHSFLHMARPCLKKKNCWDLLIS
jgi:hypothetical protein